MRYDVAIIGGGVAGLQAALTLARCLYNIVLIDAGEPRHRMAAKMHNLLGADGEAPEAFYRRAQAQLAQYPNLTRVQARVVDGRVNPDFSFHLIDAAGQAYHSGSVVFAHGVKDVLPAIEGLAECWGSEVQHCAYCHGYEARGKRIAALTTTAKAWGMVELVAHLSPRLHLLLEDGAPDAALQENLNRCGISYDTQGVQRVARAAEGITLTLRDGTAYACDVLYLQPGHAANLTLPARFGCTMTESGHISANEWGHTGIAGLYAAGDVIAGRYSQLAAAMKSGLDAAAMVHSVLSAAALKARG